jgi:hypothetical protein
LRVLVHAADDVKMGGVLEVFYDEGVGVDIVDDVCQWPDCGGTSLHFEGLQARDLGNLSMPECMNRIN